MLQYLLDTDHLTLYERGNAKVVARVLAQPDDAVGLSIVTTEEAMRGRLAVVAKARDGAARVQSYAWLLGTVKAFEDFVLAGFDQDSEDQFQQLVAQKLRIGTQDLKIASVALAHNLTLVTRNRADFGLVPGLVLEDWSV